MPSKQPEGKRNPEFLPPRFPRGVAPSAARTVRPSDLTTSRNRHQRLPKPRPPLGTLPRNRRAPAQQDGRRLTGHGLAPRFHFSTTPRPPGSLRPAFFPVGDREHRPQASPWSQATTANPRLSRFPSPLRPRLIHRLDAACNPTAACAAQRRTCFAKCHRFRSFPALPALTGGGQALVLDKDFASAHTHGRSFSPTLSLHTCFGQLTTSLTGAPPLLPSLPLPDPRRFARLSSLPPPA